MPDRRLVGIAGSLRKGSYNRALLQTAAERAPGGLSIEFLGLRPIPFFDADVEAAGDPPPVTELKSRIDDADGVLIATPEYQHGIPGLLKNALDWASRPPGGSVLAGKPVAMMGASPSPVGTARAHLQLRTTLLYVQADLITHPEVLVADAGDRIADGRLVHEASLAFLDQLLETVAEHLGHRA